MDCYNVQDIEGNYCKKNSAISVIVPIYGVEKYIERCARSLFEQTLDGVEYVFIDDCSPDFSIDILKRVIDEYLQRFMLEYKTVKIESMPVNSGQAIVRQHGVQVATGEYVIFCDSDDWVDADIYRLLYEKAKCMDADIVMCGYKVTDGNQVYSEHFHSFTDKHQLLSNLLTMRESWSLCNKLCKRSLYDQPFIFPTLAMGEDMVMTMQLVIKSERFGIISKALYNYFYNPKSITNVQSEEARYKHWRETIENAKIVCSFFQNRDLKKKHVAEIEYLKYAQKKVAGNLARKRKYCRDYFMTFREINLTALKNPYISRKNKIKFVVSLVYSKILSWI